MAEKKSKGGRGRPPKPKMVKAKVLNPNFKMKVNNYLYEAGVNEEVEMLEWHYEKAKSLGLVK